MTSTVSAPPTTANIDSARGRIGWIVGGSLTAGLVAAVLLALAPFVAVNDSAVTGAVLCGFALGWTALAVLSTRYADQPQRWASAPALFMGVSGLLLIGFGPAANPVLNWLWPPTALTLATWMVVRAHRALPGRSGRWLLYPVIALLALAAISGGYETARAAADTRAYPMPGQLLDVGGHRLHLHCTGTGSPTVILEPGAGNASSSLGWITPAVARQTRVCVYDRAGRGWSDPADTPQDAAQIATDLHTLLQRGHVPGPYVLAGHSFGGLYVLTYAARYPDEVAGMVLIDSTTPASHPGPAHSEGSTDVMHRITTLISASARLGVGRLLGWLSADGLPTQARDQVRTRSANAATIHSTIHEYGQGGASARQAAALTDFGDKPLIVLTAATGHDATESAAQNHLATLSTNSTHRTIAGSTHVSLVGDERDASATTQAILDVTATVRQPAPLSR
jgi:pimeloyl-ACP methyl ester carboxylesterase